MNEEELRYYWGKLFGKNAHLYVRDCIWGSTIEPACEVSMYFKEAEVDNEE